MPEDMIAGHRTPWRTWDRGAARAVLALHCSLAHAGAWSALAEALHGVTITALDQPGHGRAPDWDGVSNLHDMTTAIAADLAGMLGGGGPIDLFGHSFGGTVALRLALMRPDLVRSLVLVEPVLFAAASDTAAYAAFRPQHLEFAAIMQAGDRAQAAAVFHAAWGSGEAFADLPERQQRYMIDRIHHIVGQNPALLDDAAGLLRPGGLEGIRVPVLLLEGADSPPIIDAVMAALAARLPRVRRVAIAGAGHMLPITHAPDVARAVQAHLDTC